MEAWFVIILTACLATFLIAFLSNTKSKSKLPPGPRCLPIISNIQWLRKPYLKLEADLKSLHSKFGPMVTVPIGSRPITYISSHTLAHEALVQNGAVFADRPEPYRTLKMIRGNQHMNILSARYGPTWRLLRRNLTVQILHPSRLKQFSHARKWVLAILLNSLRQASSNDLNTAGIKLMDHIKFAIFSLLVFMCFGDRIHESKIREIADIIHKFIMCFANIQLFDFLPWLTKIVFHKRWDELVQLKKKQEDVLVPLIRARKQYMQKDNNGGRRGGSGGDESSRSRLDTCYVDTLLTLELQDQDKTRLPTESEIVTATIEFLTAGTDTTSSSFQWIMANIVKYPNIQNKLFQEIKGVIGADAKEVEEDQLEKMPYLKAVILEGLRRHPTGHFLLPHAVTHEVELGGYTLPKNMNVDFMVAEMAWDSEVWEDPMEFKPERFISSTGDCEPFDMTGTRGIKMMPFGAGRRMCPAYGMAILQLEYFVANLVWNFEWTTVDGEEVDLTEKQEFSVVMKHPLHARIFPRHAN